MNRRAFIKTLGGVSFVAIGGVTLRSFQQGLFEDKTLGPYAPWYELRDVIAKDDLELTLVRAAILASNPHNTQPWLFKIESNKITVYADKSRHLGSFDPFRREMYLGLGCAIENIVQAAGGFDYRCNIKTAQGNLSTTSPDENTEWVCEIEIAEYGRPMLSLSSQISKRHTHRGAYDLGRGFSDNELKKILDVKQHENYDSLSTNDLNLILFTKQNDRNKVGQIIVESTQHVIEDKEMVADSERWMRHSWKDIQEYSDGVTLDAAGLPKLMTTMAKLLPASSEETNSKYWLNNTRDVHVATAPTFGMINVRNLYDIQQTLNAGRYWQRLHLSATKHGISMQPLNQPVELVDRDYQLKRISEVGLKLAKLIKDPDWHPTFLFRMGYAKNPSNPSPRRNAESVVIK